ncbi:MAG: hypothetical protein N2255_07840 [Kiritimatiellae bacterium]|nr:hypothetical protein [Kiritimatiellia bacterium]
MTRLRTPPPVEKPDELWALLDQFLSFSLPRAFRAESLAVELARRTRFLRDLVGQQLAQEKEAPGVLSGFYEAFKHYLIATLTEEDFADLFAQTITYGLFAARTRAGDGFNRRVAFDNIPHTIGVLRDLFRFISLGDLPEQLAWCVDDIAEVLAVADARGILDRYYREGKGSDPIVHFYETFLAQYDPEERERRSVYYTPEPVVGYIVRSLHHILKTHFDKPDGLASEGVTLLDPAAGTMTFVARAASPSIGRLRKFGVPWLPSQKWNRNWPAAAYVVREPNLNPALVEALTAAYGKAPTPEDIFHYVYAVLYAPAYRAKYAPFLRMDFPRIPFTADAKLFVKLADLGGRLVGLHLLKSPELGPPVCWFEGRGDGRVSKDRRTGLRYEAAQKRVYINATQYFTPVPESVWTYQIGGYQVCDKWLKDRRERELDVENIRTYCRMVTSLGQTIRLQSRLDAVYSEPERQIVAIPSDEATKTSKKT